MPGGALAPARDDTRARLLAAAVQVYAQHGYLGATTRRA
jgi:AcrR family transcriptional regulator